MPPYTFPRAASAEPDTQLSKDAAISQNLEMGPSPPAVKPTASYEIYVKECSSASTTPESLRIPIDDPLDDILQASEAQLDAHILQLPSEYEAKQKIPTTMPELKIEKGKRHNHVLEPLETNLGLNVVHGGTKTPVKGRRVISIKKSKGNLRQAIQKNTQREVFEEDPLACHAENIMRMAMDTTAFGSFNNSFSSTFSNMLDEDSFIAKKGPSLNKDKATRIEINAQDLETAINDTLA